MKVGVGFADNATSFDAGAAAAAEAVRSGGLDRVDLVLLFATSQHNPGLLRDGIRAVVGPGARLAGAGAVGVIGPDRLGLGGCQAGVAAVQFDAGERFDLFRETGVAGREHEVGRALARRIAGTRFDGEPNLLVFYDSVNPDRARPPLNWATPLLDGMAEVLEPFPPLAGAGCVGNLTFAAMPQWFDDEITEQTAFALALSGGVRMDTTILHGREPVSGYFTITRADGPTVLELDGRPALEVVAEALGHTAADGVDDFRFSLTLGVNHGDPWGDFVEHDYMNRLCFDVDRERGGLVMFEPDLVEGTAIQIMSRGGDLSYMRPGIERLLERLEGRRPVFALYINCAGRAGALCGMEEEDAAQVQAALKGRMPLLGFYSGVEIAAIRGRPRPLDWNGVLCVFSVP